MKHKNLIMIAILLAGITLAVIMVKTAPKPQKREIVPQIPLVEVESKLHSNLRPQWIGGATVNANTSVNLKAQVVGQVVAIEQNIVPGMFVKKGNILARIDDQNYQLVLQQKQAALIQAQAKLDIELGQVQNAKANYKLSGITLKKAARSLALREPQLAMANAALSIAESQLKKAKLDLKRTQLIMPFDGYVMGRLVNVGAYVNNGTGLFEVVQSDDFWFEVKVPQAFIDVLDINQPVKIQKLGAVSFRTGSVLSVLPQVSSSDRQARILISVKNPLQQDNGQPIIRYNDYVQVTLFGKVFKNAYALKTDVLTQENFIWMADKTSHLKKRMIEIIYRGRETTWARVAQESGDQFLMSRLLASKDNMEVRINKENAKGAL